MGLPAASAPLFFHELTLGCDALPGGVKEELVSFLEDVAQVRRGPLHVCTAFNAVYFGYDLDAGAYSTGILDPEAFTLLGSDIRNPLPPVGSFVRIERGAHSLWGEVCASFGASPDVEEDGWTPGALSGAPSSGGSEAALARAVIDWDALGALTSVEHKELARIRRSPAGVVDRWGHLVGTADTSGLMSGRDHSGLYRQFLMGPGQRLLAAGDLGPLLQDSADNVAAERALQECFRTLEELLRQAPGLAMWDLYAQPVDRHQQFASGPVAAEMVDRFTRPAPGGSPRYTAVWPVLAGWEREVGAEHALELTAAASAVVDANLALAFQATAGGLRRNVDLRIDDSWQQGGVWRAQTLPVDAVLADCDPLTPAGLGHLEHLVPGAAKRTGSSSPRQTNSVVHVEHLDEALLVVSVALSEADLSAGRLPLPGAVPSLLGEGPLTLEVHHSGQLLDRDLARQHTQRGPGGLVSVKWPDSFYPGIKITVAAARSGRQLIVTTMLLPDAVRVGDALLTWCFDPVLLAEAWGPLDIPPPVGPGLPTQRPTGGGHRPPVTALEVLIVAALLRDGRIGTAHTRSLDGQQLSAAMFGPDVVTPPLLWTVIHTCEDMAAAGLLTRTMVAHDGVLPEVFTWWPDTEEAREAQRIAGGADTAARQIRHWRRPWERRLPDGHNATPAARARYAQWRIEVDGPDADTELPEGHTFVRGHRRGEGQAPAWHQHLQR
ncbi:hypothetical protein P6B95_02595 [Streptomyces atratus]|uniref:hypothetical protein n=1 Tax=Streptomyces atratus TaxID=1893 RepID=UPI0016712D88|nr:hypothetical protein [Streptomyces atratus]WPW26448.1 hypothetical protein P6B95_02595 [Streptomyces atratus]GGT73205.1 hypothetical protein GCM10010207_83720 [Streptomyces atratus]